MDDPAECKMFARLLAVEYRLRDVCLDPQRSRTKLEKHVRPETMEIILFERNRT